MRTSAPMQPSAVTRREFPWGAVRMLGRYLLPYRKRILISLILMLGVTGFELVLPYLLKVALDAYILPGRWREGWWIFPTYLGCLIALALSEYLNAYTMELSAQWMMRDVRVDLFHHLLHLPMSYYHRQPAGKLVTRVTNDVDALQELLSQGIIAILADIFVSLSIFIALLLLSPRLTLVVAACAPFVVLISKVFHTRAHRAQERIRTGLARLNAFVQEQIAGIHLVQLYRAERSSYQSMWALNHAYRSANVEAVVHYAWYYPAIRSVEVLTSILTIMAGGYLYARGAVTLGVIVAFLQYIKRFFEPLADLSDKYNIFVQAGVAAGRIQSLFGHPRDPAYEGASYTGDRPPAVRFRGVSFRYGEHQPWALQNLNLTLPPASRWAIGGVTGSGKTTLMSLLLRFYEPTRGTIELNGQPLNRYSAASLRRQFGFAFQEPFLFSTTVRRNITLDRGGDCERRLEALLEAWRTNPLIRHVRTRMDLPVRERGRNLAQSEKQVIALLRALVHDPKFLVLDEAMSALDVTAEHDLHRLIQQAMEGRTVVLIAHRLSTLPEVDGVILLHEGTLVEMGHPDELMERDSIFASFVRLHRVEAVKASGGG